MYYLTACAIFKQEQHWLNEWIEYHKARGVEHFYLYNNDDDPEESNRILQHYISKGLVTLFQRKGEYAQVDAYKHAFQSFVNDSRWMAVIDLDEFILPRTCDDICQFLEDYEMHSALVVHWNIFGSNGHLWRPPSQIDCFLRRAEENFEPNRFFKSILCPKQVIVEKVDNPHIYYYHNQFAVDENHRKNEEPLKTYTASKIRINHYCTRSFQDFLEVKSRRGLATPANERNQDFWYLHDRNEVFDDEISRRFGNTSLINQPKIKKMKGMYNVH